MYMCARVSVRVLSSMCLWVCVCVCVCVCLNKLLPESPLCTPQPHVKGWLFMVLMFLHVGVWMHQPAMLHPLLRLVPQLDKRRGKGIRLHVCTLRVSHIHASLPTSPGQSYSKTTTLIHYMPL